MKSAAELYFFSSAAELYFFSSWPAFCFSRYFGVQQPELIVLLEDCAMLPHVKVRLYGICRGFLTIQSFLCQLKN
jgi:hypothetical protein